VPGLPPRAVGLLRGDSRVAVLNASLETESSLPAPASPTGVAVSPDGVVFVVGPLERRIASYRVTAASLHELASIELPEARVLRAVAVDARSLLAADFARDVLFVAATAPHGAAASVRVATLPTCRGPLRLALSEHYVGVACLFDHAIALIERDARGRPVREVARVVHDGPIWSLALLEHDGVLFVGAGGVEDHPLVREDKTFGYVDSFVFLYGYDAARGLRRLGESNVSELSVVTPKSVSLAFVDGALTLAAFGYASDRWASVRFDPAAAHAPVAVTHAALPGCSDVVELGGRRVCANPLLDAWISLDAVPRVHPERADEPRDPNPKQKLGEALFFTTLMAPDAKSDGRLSRFTCETCHFEGGTDGRVHYSGRDDIRVSTRPLFGLANAGPHFSRAHDPDLTAVSHNEFTVVNRGNPVDPWFALDASRFPWLGQLGVMDARVPPVELRSALYGFLARFSHEENPFASAHAREFSAEERSGSASFRDRCASCHAPRLIAGDAESAVPFERWERMVLATEGAIVWSNGEYARTGVEPYVDRRGTRVPSLRRLYLKRPYLTNGSALDLEALLSVMRFTPYGTRHASSARDVDARADRLDPGERSALLSFLRLL